MGFDGYTSLENMPAATRKSVSTKRRGLLLRADEIRWSLDEPEPMPCHVAVDGWRPRAGLTGSRADLVTWWRWRYAALEAENARVGDLLAQVLSESQGYRSVSQAALAALHDLTETTCQQRRTIARFRDEIRSLREPVKAVLA